jgi:hypothetical protein
MCQITGVGSGELFLSAVKLIILACYTNIHTLEPESVDSSCKCCCVDDNTIN